MFRSERSVWLTTRSLSAPAGIATCFGLSSPTGRELATWPEGRSFPTLPSTMRITLNAILRAVFGAEGAEFTELRELLPRLVTLGSRLAVLPIPRLERWRWSPWSRFLAARSGNAITEIMRRDHLSGFAQDQAERGILSTWLPIRRTNSNRIVLFRKTT